MKKVLMAAIWAAFCFDGLAKEIKTGDTVEVKAGSVWFQNADQLKAWQRLKKNSDAKGLAAYQEKVLAARDAWQFTKALPVKVLQYDSAKRQVNVEMITPGRMQGTKWWLDSNTLTP
jgi:hypothetical protein